MRRSVVATTLAIAATASALPSVGHDLSAREARPNYTWDVNTTPHCTWWLDYTEEIPCAQILSDNYISNTQLRRWVRVGLSYTLHLTSHIYMTGTCNANET